MPINIFSENLVEKIAAGEVVSNPASILKELLENAADAKASRIEIELENAGLLRLRVSDDGHGIPMEDLPLALLNHASSKIQNFEDLHSLKSYGFRGEALASIACVSQLSLRSRCQKPKSQFGWELVGESVQKVGMPFGTVVEIRELFYNTPARKKFLDSEKKELQKILRITEAFALSQPHIALQLKHEHKLLIDWPNQNQAQRLQQVFTKDFFEQLLFLETEGEHFQIRGFFALPQLATAKRGRQWVFVNGRPVNEKVFAQTIKKAYASLIPKTAQPAFFLFLDVPSNTLDVNIHPQKTQVKILHEREIAGALFSALQKRFAEAELIYHHDNAFLYPQEIPSLSKKLHLAEHLNLQATNQALRLQGQAWSVKSDDIDKQEILQFAGLYLLLNTQGGLLLIDQHAAHERILYEEFLEKYQRQENFESLALRAAAPLALSASEIAGLEEKESALEKIGFRFQRKSKQLFLTGIPIILTGRKDYEKILLEILEDLNLPQEKQVLDTLSQRAIFYLACRSSIKANEFLTMTERRRLVKKLQSCRNPYTCPHGRPTQVLISQNNVEKLFHRS